MYSLIANISKSFSNKGELLFIPENDFNLDLIKSNTWLFVDLDNDKIPFKIESVSYREDAAIIKLYDINPDNCKTLIGKKIFLSEKEFKKLKIPFPEIINKQLLNFKVIDTQKGQLGYVSEIIEKPLQSLIEVKTEDKTILIPVDKSIIKKVDAKHKSITIKAPEGLIDFFNENS